MVDRKYTHLVIASEYQADTPGTLAARYKDVNHWFTDPALAREFYDNNPHHCILLAVSEWRGY